MILRTTLQARLQVLDISEMIPTAHLWLFFQGSNRKHLAMASGEPKAYQVVGHVTDPPELPWSPPTLAGQLSEKPYLLNVFQ